MNILLFLLLWHPWWCPWCHPTPTPTATPRPPATATPRPTPTPVPISLGVGVMYLTKSYAVGMPFPDLEPSFKNAHSNGVAIRTQWDKLEPTEGQRDFAFLDKAFVLAGQYGKKISIIVTAGVTTPKWVYDSGASRMVVTAESGVDLPMPLIWDSVFQAKWGATIKALGDRYGSKPELAYVVMGGIGRRAESYFVTTTKDQATFNSLGGLPKWKSGAEWIVDTYMASFPNGNMILDGGSPTPTDAGQTALSDVCSYAIGKYGKWFGFKSDGLSSGYGTNQFGAKEVKLLSPNAVVGFQFALPVKGDTAAMQSALTAAETLKAHFVEVYGGDCDDSTMADILDAANLALSK